MNIFVFVLALWTSWSLCVPHLNVSSRHRRGKEVPAKIRGVKKTPANRTQVRCASGAVYCPTGASFTGERRGRKSQLLTVWFVCLQTSPPPPSSTPPKPSEEEGSAPEVATQQLNGSSATSAIGQPLELASLAQPIPCALASRDNQSEGVEVEAPCCLDDCTSDGALQKEE